MRISFFSAHNYDVSSFTEANENNYQFIFHGVDLNINTAHLAKGSDAVCVFVNDELDAACLGKLASLDIKCILLRCAGFNNVDIDYAKQLGISVYRVPAYSPNSVAEHAVALVQTLNRKTHKAYNRVKKHDFSLDGLQGFDINRKTVGVIGAGKIGEVFCKIMLAFGAEVVVYDTNKNELLEALGVKYVDLHVLFKSSDIISIHCPLNENTKHLINETSINAMKDGVMLINTSRGAVIDTKDVISGLRSGKIGNLGIDVYENEKDLFFKDLSESIIEDEDFNVLSSFPNVLITGHQAFFTNEALSEIAKTTLNNATAFATSKKSECCLT